MKIESSPQIIASNQPALDKGAGARYGGTALRDPPHVVHKRGKTGFGQDVGLAHVEPEIIFSDISAWYARLAVVLKEASEIKLRLDRKWLVGLLSSSETLKARQFDEKPP